MTLLEIVKQFEHIASQQPNINYVNNGDVYELNNLPNIDYGVFFVTQQKHSADENNYTYNLTLFYVDRITTDGKNKLAIQSNGITLLTNIINLFLNNNDVELEGDIQLTTFKERFVDDCAGAFAEISIIAENELGICGYE